MAQGNYIQSPHTVVINDAVHSIQSMSTWQCHSTAKMQDHATKCWKWFACHLVLSLMLLILRVHLEDVQPSLPVQRAVQIIIVTPEGGHVTSDWHTSIHRLGSPQV